MQKRDNTTSVAEVVDATRAGTGDAFRLWVERVRDSSGGVCANCGSAHRLKVCMVVPQKAGGQLRVSNGVVLCRACEMAGDTVVGSSTKGARSRPINFYMSRPLLGRMEEGLAVRNGFASKAALVRYLMRKFVADADRFDDLRLYQDVGADTKINVWVDGLLYAAFKERVAERGMTVTQALKGLIMMYGSQVEPLVKEKAK